MGRGGAVLGGTEGEAERRAGPGSLPVTGVPTRPSTGTSAGPGGCAARPRDPPGSRRGSPGAPRAAPRSASALFAQHGPLREAPRAARPRPGPAPTSTSSASSSAATLPGRRLMAPRPLGARPALASQARVSGSSPARWAGCPRAAAARRRALGPGPAGGRAGSRGAPLSPRRAPPRAPPPTGARPGARPRTPGTRAAGRRCWAAGPRPLRARARTREKGLRAGRGGRAAARCLLRRGGTVLSPRSRPGKVFKRSGVASGEACCGGRWL